MLCVTYLALPDCVCACVRALQEHQTEFVEDNIKIEETRVRHSKALKCHKQRSRKMCNPLRRATLRRARDTLVENVLATQTRHSSSRHRHACGKRPYTETSVTAYSAP